MMKNSRWCQRSLYRNVLHPSSGWISIDGNPPVIPDDNTNKMKCIHRSWQSQSLCNKTVLKLKPFEKEDTKNLDLVFSTSMDIETDPNFNFPITEKKYYQKNKENEISSCINRYPEPDTIKMSLNGIIETNNNDRPMSHMTIRKDHSSYKPISNDVNYPKVENLTSTSNKRQAVDKLSPSKPKRRKQSRSLKMFGTPQKNKIDQYLVRRKLYGSETESSRSTSCISHPSSDIEGYKPSQSVEDHKREIVSVDDEDDDDDVIFVSESRPINDTRKNNSVNACDTTKEDIVAIDTIERVSENNENPEIVTIDDDDDDEKKADDQKHMSGKLSARLCSSSESIINISSDISVISLSSDESDSENSKKGILTENSIDYSPVTKPDITAAVNCDSLPGIRIDFFLHRTHDQDKLDENLPSSDKQTSSSTPLDLFQSSSFIARRKHDTETRQLEATNQEKGACLKSISDDIECLDIYKDCNKGNLSCLSNKEKDLFSIESKDLNIHKDSNKENSSSISNKEIHHCRSASPDNIVLNAEILASDNNSKNLSQFVVPKSGMDSVLINVLNVDTVGISSPNLKNVNSKGAKCTSSDIDELPVNKTGNSIIVSESSEEKYSISLNSASDLVPSNCNSAIALENYENSVENVSLRQCNPISEFNNGAWASTNRGVNQDSHTDTDRESSPSVEDNQADKPKIPNIFNLGNVSSSFSEENNSSSCCSNKNETRQEGGNGGSPKQAVNITFKDLKKALEKVMLEHHNEAARRMGLRRLTPCCINPYSCPKFHTSKGSEALVVCTPIGQIIVNNMEESLWHITFQLFSTITSYKTYPPSEAVLLLLNYILKTDDDTYMKDAVAAVKKIIDLHPPCAPNMLKYYTSILTETVENGKTPDISTNGIFCDIISKLSELIIITKSVDKDENSHSNQLETRKKVSETFTYSEMDSDSNSDNLSITAHEGNWENKNFKLSEEEKIQRLFFTLEPLVEIIELDLAVFLVKRISNFRRAVGHPSYKPLLVSTVWKTSKRDRVGKINEMCRLIIQLYVECYRQKFCQKNTSIINRLLNLVGELVQASDFSTDRSYPYFGENCWDLARETSQFMKKLVKEDLEAALSNLMPSYLKLLIAELLLNYGNAAAPTLKTVIDILTDRYLVSSKEEREPDTSKENIMEEVKPGPSVHKKKKNINKRNHKGETKLHEVCRANKLDELNELLQNPELDINVVDNYGWTPLHEAAAHGSIECVMKLLEHVPPAGKEKLNLRAKSQDGTTPLIDAVLKNNIAICKLLLEYGGPLLLKDRNKTHLTALDIARCPEVKDLLEQAKFAKVPSIHHEPLPSNASLLIPVYVESYLDTYQILKIIRTLKDLKQRKTIVEAHPRRVLKLDYPKFKNDYNNIKALKELLRKEDFRISEVLLELKILLS